MSEPLAAREAPASYLVELDGQRVRSGYKQTEVGVIPEDWEIVPLGQRLRRTPSYGINAPAIQFDSRFPTYLRITDITEDGTFSEGTKASVDHPAASTYMLESGDVVFARTGASVGKSYLYNPKDGRLVFAGFLIRITPDPVNLVPAYLSFFVQSRTYWNWVKVNSMRSGQPGINGREYASLPVPLPPTKVEQEAIAEALSDADALIESLEQLIAKKRHLKQGTMQELLTGRKRLPGFGGVWEVRRLGSVLKFQVGFPFSSLFFNEDEQGIRLVKNRDLKSDDQVFHYSGKFDQEYLIRDGDVLVGMDGDFLPCLWAKGRALLNQRVGRIVPLAGLDRAFVFYFLIEPLKEIQNVTSCTTVKHLSHGDIEGIEKPLPCIEEQTAIATILSDMDADIATLAQQLVKARDIKRGMMQELLTGRIRLV